MSEFNYDFGEDRNQILDNLDGMNEWTDSHISTVEMGGTSNKIIACFERDGDMISVSTETGRGEWFAKSDWDDDWYQTGKFMVMVWICKKMYLRDDRANYDEMIKSLNTLFNDEIIDWVEGDDDCLFIGAVVDTEEDKIYIVKHSLVDYQFVDEFEVSNIDNIEELLQEYK